MNKKIFTAIFTFLLFIPLTLSMTSCSDDDDTTPIDITGEWYWEAGDEYMDIEFKNGTFIGEVGDDDNGYGTYATISGSYTISDNQITLNITRCSNPKDFEEFETGTILQGTADGNTISINITGVNILLVRDISI